MRLNEGGSYLRQPAIQLHPSTITPALAEALTVLETGDFQARWEVAKRFSDFGAVAIAPLIERIQDDELDWELRWFVARILGQFDQPETVAALIHLLITAEDEDLSLIAAEALANLGPSAVVALSNLLGDSAHRSLAVKALAQIRQSATITPLLEVVNDPEAPIRAIAIEALSSFRDARITPVLISALQDEVSPVRREAVTALGLRGDLLDQFDLVDQLQARLWDVNLEVCRCAAIALGRLGTESAAQALLAALKRPHTPVSLQIEIIRSLSWIPTETALSYLSQGLALESAEVHYEVIMALGRMETPPLKAAATQVLISLLETDGVVNQSSQLKQAVALGLAQLGQLCALDPLIQLLADTDVGIRLHGIAALKQLAPQAAYTRLQNRLNQTDLSVQLRQGIEVALQEW